MTDAEIIKLQGKVMQQLIKAVMRLAKENRKLKPSSKSA